MLTQLYIRNIAVIEKAEIDFHPGFTVLTGETGAGKSIIIDAIYAVLGERTSKELIRTGADQAAVSALFTGISKETEQVLRELSVPLEEDGSLLIRREIRQNGRSSCKLNNSPATVSMLKAVGATLIDILGQHESYKLLSPEAHGAYIDSFAGTNELLVAYRSAYGALRRIKGELDALESDEGQKARRMDILRYQIEELEAAQLRVGEQVELAERRDEIRNSERIVRSVSEACALLQGDENEDGAVSAVSVAAEALEQAARFAPSLNGVAQRVRDAEYALSDAAAEVSDYLDNAMFDPGELDELESRLETLYRLSLKYGETEAEMLEFLDRARKELSDIEFSDEKRGLLLEEYEEKKKEAVSLAKQLSAKRRAACESFAKRVKAELSELNMPGVTFSVEQVRTPLTSFGCDRIQFLVSANAGEEPKPMSKIASGGELSRIMLAINTVLSDTGMTETQIFDEIDTGISGEAANKVGAKLRGVSKNAQVICVTHLAQIAAMADNHLYIVKKEENNKTYTAVHPLDQADRVREIARIIGGDDITPLKLKMAEEMLNVSNGAKA
ncbi:DNA repair protein RecN [Anaeromassilibacillus senegalensis]|uniref:DNA repair protein RecN n=1 Tax=Anaeromassilibacillus senegalensis TaxID=1673717 RepID=A0ABS9CKV0_9FIRM|nr:DNA repair protein RecN [Anaeromassilibacillus senegalensis]MCF2651761.1 DNA repair protein RecN [Anaeromassilibacillus senegalensis]